MGREKPILSFRVDSDLKEQLDSDENLNTSGLMRSLLESYLLAGDAVEVGLERRLNDKQNELERKRIKLAQVESEIEGLEHEVDDIREKIKQRRESTPEEVVAFAEKVRGGQFREEQLVVDNPAVENWARKAGISGEEFVRLVEDRL